MIVLLILPIAFAQIESPSLLPITPPSSQPKTDDTPVLRANVQYTWTPEKAKAASFNGVGSQIDTSSYPSKDPEFDSNFQARLQNKTLEGNKVLSFFSNGDYCYYHIGDYRSTCYHENGSLYKISISNHPKGLKIYPSRDADYSYPEGKLVGAGLFVNSGESFIYTANGDMLAHWKGPNAYNDQGEVIMTREWVKSADTKESQIGPANTP